MDSFSGLIPYPCKILSLQNPIDHRRFPNITLPGKGNFRKSGPRKIFCIGGRNQKFNILKIHSFPHLLP